MAELSLTDAMILAEEHRRAGRLAEARDIADKVLAVQPDFPAAIFTLAQLASNERRFDDAVAHSTRLVALQPNVLESHLSLAWAMLNCGRLDEAGDSFRMAIQIDPNCAPAHYGLSWVLLAQGDFVDGLAEHNWRRLCPDLPGRVRKFPQPEWDGSDLNGKTILLYQEQGLGDLIQYVRYVPMVAARGGKIIFGCDIKFGRLLRSIPGSIGIALDPNQLPPFDTHLSVHEFPRIFGTTLETIPNKVPYLTVPPSLVEEWRRRIDRREGALHVGFCWAGNPKHPNDKLRSIPLSEFEILGGNDRIRLFSLQKGPPATELTRLPASMNVTDCNVAISDFADTAAAMMNLDLIIAVDTSVAHLAGALARPVWMLLPNHADWRWLLNREDSPWYPTMRLFRCPSRGDWKSVMQRVKAEILRLHQ